MTHWLSGAVEAGPFLPLAIKQQLSQEMKWLVFRIISVVFSSSP